MKRWLIAFVVLFSAARSAAGRGHTEAKPLNVLFLGNSYTGFGEMTEMVEALSKAANVDRPVAATQVAYGGYTLEEQWNVAERVKKKGITENLYLKTLREGDWDVVVVQGHHNGPTHWPAKMLEYGQKLAAEVKKKNARLVFYQTWPAPKDKNQTAPDWLKKINDVYFALSKKTGGMVSPAGIAFELAKQRKPGIGSVIHYGKTNHHPSRVGSYLIACCHFATIYGKSPVGLPPELYRSERDKTRNRPFVKMDAETAKLLQTAAWDAVRDAKKRMTQTAVE